MPAGSTTLKNRRKAFARRSSIHHHQEHPEQPTSPADWSLEATKPATVTAALQHGQAMQYSTAQVRSGRSVVRLPPLLLLQLLRMFFKHQKSFT